MSAARLVAFLVLIPFACTSGTDDEDDLLPPADAGETMDATLEPDAGEERNVEIGTGVDGFESLYEGEQVMLVQGPQGGGRMGGFHVWHGVKTRGMNPEAVTLSFAVYLPGSTEAIASQNRRANLQPAGGDSHVGYGFAPPFTDCCQAANQDIVMHVTVTDVDGKSGSDERLVHAMGCIDVSGTDLCR